MQPKKSYRVWLSNRNGSTVLCKGLEQTDIAGRPEEYFNLMGADSLCKKYEVQTYDDLKQRLWQLGTSNNGVFGMKLTNPREHQAVLNELRSLRGIEESDNVTDEELLHDLFPNCQDIFLTRRNKVRQAVSWWKAIKNNVWHIEAGQQHVDEEDFYEQHYDFAALHHLFTEAALRECDIQEYFATHQIQPLTLVYEDFIVDFKRTIHQVIDYLAIDYDVLNVKNMFYAKTANEGSEQWVQRFRKELQQDWQKKAW